MSLQLPRSNFLVPFDSELYCGDSTVHGISLARRTRVFRNVFNIRPARSVSRVIAPVFDVVRSGGRLYITARYGARTLTQYQKTIIFTGK